MSPSWPLEALKAQAIASRTYALYQKRRSQLRFYDVENTTQDQVYDGSESETPRSYSAVQATSKLLLTWNAEPIKAFYHANCGGSTESPAAVWGNGYSYFRPVQCPYHHGGAGTQMRWNVSFSKIQLQNALKKISGLLPLKFSRLAWVEAGPLNPHDRREVIKITDNIGKQVLISSNSFRNALGNTRVKSTAFSLQNDGETILLRGKGFGHGVGLCQIGAREMAKQGKSFRDILALYYSFAKLKAY
jgi:stage II sporulation protein D